MQQDALTEGDEVELVREQYVIEITLSEWQVEDLQKMHTPKNTHS